MIINANDPYMTYYRHQVGGAVPTVFRGGGSDTFHRQHGHGIGSFLGGLFRSVMPILKSGATAIGKEALRSGVGFLTDVTSMDQRTAASTRLKEFTGGLKRRADEKLDRVLQGRGASMYKKRRVNRVTPQSLANLLRVRMKGASATKKKKKKKKRQSRSTKRRRTTKKRSPTVGKSKRRTKQQQQQRRKRRKSSSTKRKRRNTTLSHQDIFV